VLAAISFDDQPRFEANEVYNEVVDRFLSAKSPALEPSIAQQTPQGALCICHVLSEFACVLDGH
jgi:hypothetical protein